MRRIHSPLPCSSHLPWTAANLSVDLMHGDHVTVRLESSGEKPRTQSHSQSMLKNQELPPWLSCGYCTLLGLDPGWWPSSHHLCKLLERAAFLALWPLTEKSWGATLGLPREDCPPSQEKSACEGGLLQTVVGLLAAILVSQDVLWGWEPVRSGDFYFIS